MEKIDMSAAHAQIRLIIYLLHVLHQMKYTNLRFMPEVDGDNFSVYIGPRRFFAQSDGLYLADEFLHRAVHFKIDSVIPSPDDFIQLLEKNMNNGFTSGPAAGLHDIRDPEYAFWLKSLVNFLGDFDLALPCRASTEHLNKSSAALRIEFCYHIHDRRLAPTIHFTPPPGGALSVGSRSMSGNEETRIAQPLPESAKGLRWNVRTGYSKDQLSDKTYESNI